MGMQLIETIELASVASTITFSSIPQDGKDLLIISSARTGRLSIGDGIELRPNGSTADGSRVFLFGSGSTVTSSTATNIRAGNAAGFNSTSNTFGNSSCYISNYSGSSAKSFSVDGVSENNGTDAGLEIAAALWNSTTAITSLELRGAFANDFQPGSSFQLYKITAD